MEIPIGTVIPYAGNARANVDTLKMQGWLICDGAAVSRTIYKLLFEAISTIHGQGDGATTFNLPDYRGRFLRGVNEGSGRDPDAGSRTAANTGGLTKDNVGSIQPSATALPVAGFSTNDPGSHTHKIEYNWNGQKGSPAPTLVMPEVDATYYPGDSQKVNETGATSQAGAHTHQINGGDRESRPINAYVYWLIKYQ
jgi:phage-related tail fiber protein